MAEPARQLDSSDGLDEGLSREERKAQLKANSPSANPQAEGGSSTANLQAVPTAPDRGEDEETDTSPSHSGSKQSSGRPNLKVIKGGKDDKDGSKAPESATSGAAATSSGSAAGGGAAKAASAASGSAGVAIKLASVAAGAKKNKKGLIAGGGVLGLLLALILGFMALLPLKIEAMIQNVMSKRFGFVQHSIEKRVEKIFIGYTMKYSDAAGEPPIVATGNPLRDLYKTWKINHTLEKQLGPDGLKMESTGVRGHVRIVLADGEAHVFNSESEFAAFMDQDLGPRKGAELIDIIVKNDTHWWQFVQRSHLRRWMRLAFGINNWQVLNDDPKADEGKTAEDETVALDESETQVEDSQYLTNLDADLGCIAGGACPAGTPSDPTGMPAELNAGSGAGSAVSTAIKGAFAKIGKVVSAVAALQSAYNEAINKAIEGAAVYALSKIIDDQLAADVVGKSVPYIGWVDLAAHIDSFIWNDRIGTIVKDLREVQYAAVFANWAIIASQVKEGTATAPAINAALNQLNGMETSSAYCADFLGKDSNCGTSPNPNNLFSLSAVNAFTAAYKTAFLPLHLAGVAYFHTIGPIYDFLQSLLGWAVSEVFSIVTAIFPPFGDMLHFVTGLAGKGLMWIIMQFLGPVVTAADAGFEIMNAVDIGGDITANSFCQNVIGCPLAQTAQQYETLQDQVAMANREDTPGLWDRLFSTDYPGSYITRLAAILPTSPILAVEDSFTSLMGVITSPFQISNNGLKFAFDMTTPQAAAAAPADPYGIDQYGYTNAQLNAPIDENALNQATQNAAAQGRTVDQVVPSDCPQVPAGQENECELDVTAISDLKAAYTSTDDGGLNASGD